jgi:hypothetical protein
MPHQKTKTETENEKRIRQALQAVEYLRYNLIKGYYAETTINGYAVHELNDIESILEGNLEYEEL